MEKRELIHIYNASIKNDEPITSLPYTWRGAKLMKQRKNFIFVLERMCLLECEFVDRIQ
jgi:hypothetical protein